MLIEIAALLSGAAAVSGRDLTEWSRSTRAVALKVGRLRRGLADESFAVRLGAVAFDLIRLFRSRIDDLHAEVEVAVAELRALVAAPSRGPVPWLGTLRLDRTDDRGVVYGLVLDGDADALLPGAVHRGGHLFKIGRTSDLVRRVRELNCGFPPAATMRWRAFASCVCDDVFAAHALEQSILAAIHRRGASVGGEFAISDARSFIALIEGAGLQVTIRPASAATRSRIDNVNPGAGT